MARVLLQNVTKRFPGVEAPAVDGVTIEARDREFLVLVGPSGCGKSTTLRMVAGLEEPTSGEVHIGGRRVDGVPPQERDVAMIFQNYALYPHMTVYENLGFPLRMRRMARDEADRRVRSVAEMLGLTEFLNRKPRALSGGQRQRTAVGRAIVREPRVFLFDEPLSNLDAKMRVTMRKEIRRLHRELETTMIYVTHDQTEALTMGDRIVVMNEGRVQQAASPRELYDRPANRFVAGFIGSPPMNFFSGELGAAGEKLLFNAGSFELALPEAFGPRLRSRAGGPIDLGLRPEDIADEPAEGRAKIAAEVTAVEPLGSETLLYLKTGESEFVARLGPEASATVGERMRVYFNLAKSHFFDPESGDRLD